ncbi:MAG TPA: PfkB family carbohydrate kinase, partial [Solirubrobacterales bacterium]
SGDCFLAGYVAARFEGANPRDCLAFGVACGAESTQHFGAGTLDRREVDRLLARVEVSELAVPARVA